ncbi:hypothetical protein RR46_08322 [Papilio xuthus]|uniref:Uncharacterized protein n=1 Tax=Papilio xuthus TaxID=66420 RepID=A0A194PEV7_PAPXU|nr:hypothetical protein RR46_08322 [Papilio xuthus]
MKTAPTNRVRYNREIKTPRRWVNIIREAKAHRL